MTLIMVLVFALAISMDSFLVGISYGIKNIILPGRSIIIVTAFSGVLLLLFMLAGDFIAAYLSPSHISVIAASLLAALGIWKIVEAYREQLDEDAERKRIKNEKLAQQAKNPLLFYLRVPFLPYAIQVLHEPERAAKRISNGHTVEKVENAGAWALGMAMAFDAVGGGFAASLAGLPIVLTVVVSLFIMGALLVFALLIGRKFRRLLVNNKKSLMEKVFNYLPGILIICLAVWKICQ
ncbi:MAG: hypothetical protein ACOX7H_03810 [Bacillota bacterium]